MWWNKISKWWFDLCVWCILKKIKIKLTWRNSMNIDEYLEIIKENWKYLALGIFFILAAFLGDASMGV